MGLFFLENFAPGIGLSAIPLQPRAVFKYLALILMPAEGMQALEH